jgi:hypothetical protein
MIGHRVEPASKLGPSVPILSDVIGPRPRAPVDDLVDPIDTAGNNADSLGVVEREAT